ncbi:uncharacterized protein [Temnothorax longispinosus]|uniref:uncharacterized protein isoform X2 n=1 Tax=Temnothorax longispinosus TaxID=300112 RepID=UPI003A9A4113
MNVQSERNLPDVSLVIPPPIDEVDNTDDVTSVTTCQPIGNVQSLPLHLIQSFLHLAVQALSHPTSLPHLVVHSSVASNKLATTSPALNVQKILTALSTAKESNLDQDISSSSAGVLVLKAVFL